MNAYPWIRLWIDMLQHPKIRRLTSDEFRLWVLCLTLAGLRREEHGRFYLAHGQPYCHDDLADLAKIPLECVAAGLSKMASLGMIIEDEDGIPRILSWDERQFGKPSNHPAAIRKRVQKTRVGNADESRMNRDGIADGMRMPRVGNADESRMNRVGIAAELELCSQSLRPPGKRLSGPLAQFVITRHCGISRVVSLLRKKGHSVCGFCPVLSCALFCGMSCVV